MVMVYEGKRLNQEPGKETYTSLHRGTDVYLRSIRAEIAPASAVEEEDVAVDSNGKYIGASD